MAATLRTTLLVLLLVTSVAPVALLGAWEHERVSDAAASVEEARIGRAALDAALHAEGAALRGDDPLAAAEDAAPVGTRVLLVEREGAWRSRDGSGRSDALASLVAAAASGTSGGRDPVSGDAAMLGYARVPSADAAIVLVAPPPAAPPAALWAFLGLLGFVAAGVALLAVIVTSRVVTPLRALDDAAARFDGEGALDLPPATGSREMRRLRETLRRMSERIQSQRVERAAYAEGLDRLVRDRTRSLAEARADVEALVFTVAHELREPLRSIRTLGGVVVADGDAEEALDALRLASDEAARLERILLDLMRFDELGRRDLATVDVDLGVLAEEAAQTVRGEGAALDWRVGDLPTVRASPALLQEAFVEIARNAAQHGGGVLHVRGEVRDDGAVEVSFDDAGPGIPVPRREDAFHLFQRLDRGSPGTGVGLAIVRRVAERHDGSARIEASPTGGTRVVLALPRDGPAPRVAEPEAPGGRTF